MMKRPRKQSTFSSTGSELNYLNDWISYWWHQRLDQAKALQLCDRFEELLIPQGRDDGSLALQEHWGLLHEVRGNLDQAIWHREREIALLNRLFEISDPIGEIDHKYLANRLGGLAELYKQNGDLDKAVQALGTAKELAKAHKFHFYWQDLLDE